MIQDPAMLYEQSRNAALDAFLARVTEIASLLDRGVKTKSQCQELLTAARAQSTAAIARAEAARKENYAHLTVTEAILRERNEAFGAISTRSHCAKLWSSFAPSAR